jgi:D-alanine-D-alanine ligase
VTKVKSAAALKHAFDDAFAESDTVIVEEYIAGRELQHGVFKTAAKTVDLPVTEIFSHNEFFDYAAKYKGQSKEVTPAALTPELSRRLSAQSQLIYDYLDCKGVVRIDYIVRDEEIYFLEINTVPGMSAQSIVPQQLHAAGVSLAEAFTLLIENSLH